MSANEMRSPTRNVRVARYFSSTSMARVAFCLASSTVGLSGRHRRFSERTAVRSGRLVILLVIGGNTHEWHEPVAKVGQDLHLRENPLLGRAMRA